MVSAPIISCEQLTKSFGTYVALRDCNLQVASGKITGLLGPNGAGKTTLLRTLLGFQRPSSGSAKVCGLDCVDQSVQVRQQVAYLPGEARLFRSMTGHGVLRIFSGLSLHGDLGRCRRVADRLELDLSRRVMFMSTGMRQKLALSIVLGSTAPLVVLDEPTANLDPSVRGEVMRMVQEANREGQTVLLSSHIFSDIDDTCDEVVILRSGQLVHQQLLNRDDSLHIVHGRTREQTSSIVLTRLRALSDLPGKDGTAKVADTGSDVDFIRYCSVKQPEAERADVELHLSGDPQRWLAWLSELKLDEVSIQQSGVRAIYERFHA